MIRKKDIYLPSPAKVLSARNGTGGWTEMQLAQWGVPWPPPKGWIDDLARRWKEQNGGKVTHSERARSNNLRRGKRQIRLRQA